jgi:hypothetical protein
MRHLGTSYDTFRTTIRLSDASEQVQSMIDDYRLYYN